VPNILAWLVMFVWPVVVIVTYQKRRGRASAARTTAWMLFLGIMFLPSSMALDAPLIPPMNKCALTALACWVSLQLFHRNELLQRAPGHQMPRLLLAAMVYAAYMTIATNGDVLRYGRTELQGLPKSEVISYTFGILFDFYIPFTVSQRVFKTERDLRDLLDVLTRCLLIYIPFVLYELKMAPVLHERFYGYGPFGFAQAVRDGGYRPNVFMAHGLVLAVFTCAAFAAARGLVAAGVTTKPLRPKPLLWLSFVMVLLTKTLAAMIYGALCWLLIRRPTRTFVISIFLLVVCGLVAAYPSMRIAGSFPTYKLVEWAKGASAERASSLQFRFDNEDVLLVRSLERPMWGWGGYGRSRVYDEDGVDTTIADGLWIIWFGASGFAGLYLNLAAVFLPMLRTAFRLHKVRPSAVPLLAVLAVVSGFLVIDILPNGRYDYLSMIMAGAMWTLSETLTRPLPKKRKVEPSPVPPTPTDGGAEAPDPPIPQPG